MQRARSTRWLVVGIAAIVASIAQPAAGASLNDPPYARGPLDLKRLIANKHDAGAPLHVTVVTYGTWPANTLDVAGQNRIFISFNPDHQGEREYVGEVLFKDGRLWMRIEDRAGTFVRRVSVSHPAGDVIKVTIPKGLPNPNGHSWVAASERWVTATGSCAQGCRDRAPGWGWLKVTPGQ
jgi:hypothetical protein